VPATFEIFYLENAASHGPSRRRTVILALDGRDLERGGLLRSLGFWLDGRGRGSYEPCILSRTKAHLRNLRGRRSGPSFAFRETLPAFETFDDETPATAAASSGDAVKSAPEWRTSATIDYPE
jgi:hypothetical protein